MASQVVIWRNDAFRGSYLPGKKWLKNSFCVLKCVSLKEFVLKSVALKSDLFKHKFSPISNYYRHVKIILLGENVRVKDNYSILFRDLTYALILNQGETF